MWTTGAITAKSATGPESADVTIVLTGDADEKAEVVLPVDARTLLQSPDYIAQQIEARLQERNAAPGRAALIEQIREGAVYTLVPGDEKGAPLVLAAMNAEAWATMGAVEAKD